MPRTHFLGRSGLALGLIILSACSAGSKAQPGTVPPQISFSAGISGSVNAPISSATPTNTGGSITSCGITPTLPSGLSISSTCTISGTPTTSANSTYTVTASNSGGTGSATIAISIVTVPSKLAWSGSSAFLSGICSAFVVIAQDTSGNASNVSSLTTVSLSGAGSGSFFSDVACGTAATSASIAAGTSSQTIYFKDNTAESVNLTASATGLTSGFFSVALEPSKIAVTGSTPIIAGSCSAYSVTSQDANGSVASVASATSVALSNTGFGSFFSDAACSSTITSTTISAGTSSKTVYFKDNWAESPSISATAAGLAVGTLPIVIGPSNLVLTGSSPITSGSCTAYTITSKDVNAIVANVPSATTVSLSGVGSGSFYSDAGCTTPVISTTIAMGTSSQTVYLKDNSAQTLSLVAAATGMTSGTLSVAVGPSKLALTGTTPIIAGTCVAYTITSQDANGATANVPSSIGVSLSGGGAGAFYSTAACSSMITVTTLSAGTNTKTVYFLDNSAQNLTLSASAGGLTAGTLGITVGPSKLGWSGPSSVTAGSCTAFSVVAQDQNGAAANVSGAATVSVTGVTSGSFYSDSGCTTTTTSVVIAAGTSSQTVYLNDTTAEALTLSDSATGLTSGTYATTVTGASAMTLTWAGSANIRQGGCISYTVGLKDTYGNPSNAASATTVSVATTGLGAYFSDSTCTTPATSVTIGAGSSSNAIYYQDGTIESVTLTASSAGLITANTTVGIFSITSLAVGEYHSCAISSTGNAYCWGRNDFGDLGTGSLTTSLTPVEVLGVGGTGYLSSLSKVAATGSPGSTYSWSCALSSAGNVYCWGSNGYADLGNGLLTDSSTPVEVVGVGGSGFLSGITDIAAQTGGFTCAVSSGGNVYCWGYNSTGELGNNTNTTSSTPVEVLGVGGTGYLSGISRVSLGISHSCALSSGGNVYCWGYNGAGELGNNTLTDSWTPVEVVGVGGTGYLSSITALAVGEDTSCALSSTGNVYCWGYNPYGELGNGTVVNSKTPVEVLGVGGSGYLSSVTALKTGWGYTCAMSSSANLYCWGYGGNGALGNGGTSSSSTPVEVLAVGGTGFLSNISTFDATGSSACALDTSGGLYCWGLNDNGQLGDGTTTNSSIPVSVNF